MSVFLTILTCYVCKRYWKRTENHDNQVYRVACTTSTSPHVFPLESFQQLHPNAFLKSPEHNANLCGDISVISSHHSQPYRFISSRPVTSASLFPYQHSSLLRQHRHDPPPPYHLNVISGNVVTPNSNGTNRNASTQSHTNNNQMSDQITDPKSFNASSNTNSNTNVKTFPRQNNLNKKSNVPVRFTWKRLSQ